MITGNWKNKDEVSNQDEQLKQQKQLAISFMSELG